MEQPFNWTISGTFHYSRYFSFGCHNYRGAVDWCIKSSSSGIYVFLAVPVMFGLSAIKILKFGVSFTSVELLILIIGMVVAFAVSVLVIKFLMGYIKNMILRHLVGIELWLVFLLY